MGIYCLVVLHVVVGRAILAAPTTRRAGLDEVAITVVEQRLAQSRGRTARWHQALQQLTAGFDGRVGVCATAEGSSDCVNGDQSFPMQSVWKLPLAVAILDAVDRGTARLDERVVIRPQDLSVFVQPLAKLVGPNGFTTTVDDLVRRAIVDSDNAAGDILLARLGGPAAIQVALGRHAIVGIRVDRDEKHLQTDINGLAWRPEYLNPEALDRAIAAVPEATRDAAFRAYLHDDRDTATPQAVATLLSRLAAGTLLTPASTAHLLDLLNDTTTFPDRLKAGVPPGWALGHKTGTSGDWRGVTAATNDVGLLRAPDGGYVGVAVFIAGSRASAADRAALMAHIAASLAAAY
jgi:beta-lactamase class A